MDQEPGPPQGNEPELEGLFEQAGRLPSLEMQRAFLKEALSERCHRVEQQPDLGEQTAYEIAGLLSLDTLRVLPDDDPLVAVLALAGRLELPKEHRGPDSTWQRLSELVERL